MRGGLKLGAQAIAVAGVGVLATLLVWNLTHQTPPPKVGAPAPAFSLGRLTGDGDLSLRSLRGKTVVLNFFASWCDPCKREATVLERDWRRYRRRGVAFLGVDYHDLAPDARRFVSAHALTFPMLEDGSGTVTGSYGIHQVPETYVLNRQGRIVAHLAGPITAAGFSGEFRSVLAKAVA